MELLVFPRAGVVGVFDIDDHDVVCEEEYLVAVELMGILVG